MYLAVYQPLAKVRVAVSNPVLRSKESPARSVARIQNWWRRGLHFDLMGAAFLQRR
jgi:hypothetical protein